MKRYSASSKKAQHWIRKASKDNLFLCSIYDELGLYRQSESIYESTIKIAKFIRVSEDVKEDEENPETPEEDVDILYIEDVNNGRYDYGDVNRLYDNEVSGFEQDTQLNEINYSKQHINEFIRALSMGGANVKTSLQHLSIALNRWTMADQRIIEVKLALSYYYKNPLFTHPYGEFSNKMLLLWDNILRGNVDQDTVAIMADFNDQINKDRSTFSTNYQTIQQFLKSYKPDLANNDLFIKFIMKRLPELIDDADLEKLKKNIDFVDPLAIDKALQIAQKASSRLLQNSQTYNLNTLENFINFFSAYPQPKVFQKAMYLLETDRMFYQNALEANEANGEINLQIAIFGTTVPINKYEMKFYPGFMDYLLERKVPNRGYQNITKGEVNETLLLGGLENFEDFYGMPDKVKGEKYFSDKPEERAFFENNPNLRDINNLKNINIVLWWVLGSRMNQADATNGLRAFYNLSKIINPNYVENIVECFIPSLLPVYIEYFSNDNFLINVDWQSSNSFLSFNKFYTLYGDKIFNLNFDRIRSFGDKIDKDTYNIAFTHMSFDKYEILEKTSGEYLKDDDIFTFYFQKPYAYNIPFETLKNFLQFVCYARYLPFDDSEFNDYIYNQALQNLYIVGKYDPLIYDTVAAIKFNAIHEYNKEYLLKLVYQYKNPDGATFIGDYDKLLYQNYVAEKNPELSFTELFFIDDKRNITETVNKIREQMSKYRNYAHIVPNSEEYNKLFPVFAKNFTVIGRDPKLITTLVDCVIEGQQQITNRVNEPIIAPDNKIYYISAAIGTNNLKDMDKWALNGLTSFSGFENIFLRHNQSNEFCRKSGVKAAHIINLGGFEVLFEMSEEEVREWLEKIGARDIEQFINEWKIYAGHPRILSTLHLKIDFKILHNKVLYLLYKSFFDRLKVENPDIFNDLGTGSNFAKILYTQRWSNFFQEFQNDLELKVLNGVECEPELLRIYKLDVKLPRQLVLPKFLIEARKTTLNDVENISNIGKIVQVLGNLSMEILDSFSFDACRAKGYPTKGFLATPDSGLKKQIIHDLASFLPTNLNQKFGGYPQYFKNNMKDDEKGDLKFVGDSWSKKIAIWDENNNILEEGFVYEFSSKYPLKSLTEIIKRDSFQSVIKKLPVKNMTFAYQFCDIQGLPSEKDNESARYNQLFSGTQEIFLQGLKVPMPDWSSFKSKSNNLTLRFLQRNDPKGMFLGLLSRCCQEPQNWAASCAYDGHLNPNAAFAVFEGPEGLIFQAYVWADINGNVCFDSIESSKIFDYTAKYGYDAEELMKQFAESLPSGKTCVVGRNPLFFSSSVKKEDLLYNPTETFKLDFVYGMLNQFSPNKTQFYRSDSLKQYFVGVGK